MCTSSMYGICLYVMFVKNCCLLENKNEHLISNQIIEKHSMKNPNLNNQLLVSMRQNPNPNQIIQFLIQHHHT